MQAIVQDTYGAADVLSLRDIERPAVGDDDVLVRVHAAGIHMGDWHLMTGTPYLLRLGVGIRAPKVRVRGIDVAGTVESVGKNVTRFRAGDEVLGCCDGAFAEYACTRHDRLVPKPANLTFEQAASLPTSGFAALRSVRDAGRVVAGQKVLVIGAAGGVGTFAVQLATSFGAEVTGVCSTTKTELVRSIGAHDVIDYTREDFAAGTRRYDVIIDTAGYRSLSHVRRALTPTGTLVVAGGEGGGRWLGGAERQLRAMLLSPFVRHTLRGLMSMERRDDLETLRELTAAGRVTPVIDRTYSLREVPDAFRYLERGQARGKVVIRVRDDQT